MRIDLVHQCIAAALQILDTQILDQLILFPLIVK